jgi:hypothetical protein
MNKQLSTVATLGNRLAKRFPRSEAFRKAWAMTRQGTFVLPVAGVSFGSRQEALRRLAGYAPEDVRVFIAREADNPADANALAVMVGVQNGRGLYRLGYVPAREAWALSVLPDHGKAIFGKLAAIIGDDIKGARLALRIA